MSWASLCYRASGCLCRPKSRPPKPNCVWIHLTAHQHSNCLVKHEPEVSNPELGHFRSDGQQHHSCDEHRDSLGVDHASHQRLYERRCPSHHLWTRCTRPNDPASPRQPKFLRPRGRKPDRKDLESNFRHVWYHDCFSTLWPNRFVAILQTK